jgi:hypothetical protein
MICDLQNFSWDHLEEEDDVEKIWTNIKDKYDELVDTFVPKKKFKQKKVTIYD